MYSSRKQPYPNPPPPPPCTEGNGNSEGKEGGSKKDAISEEVGGGFSRSLSGASK